MEMSCFFLWIIINYFILIAGNSLFILYRSFPSLEVRFIVVNIRLFRKNKDIIKVCTSLYSLTYSFQWTLLSLSASELYLVSCKKENFAAEHTECPLQRVHFHITF